MNICITWHERVLGETDPKHVGCFVDCCAGRVWQLWNGFSFCCFLYTAMCEFSFVQFNTVCFKWDAFVRPEWRCRIGIFHYETTAVKFIIPARVAPVVRRQSKPHHQFKGSECADKMSALCLQCTFALVWFNWHYQAFAVETFCFYVEFMKLNALSSSIGIRQIQGWRDIFLQCTVSRSGLACTAACKSRVIWLPALTEWTLSSCCRGVLRHFVIIFLHFLISYA